MHICPVKTVFVQAKLNVTGQLDGHQPKFCQALHSISAYFTSCVFLLLTRIPLLIHVMHLEISYPCVTFLVRARNSAETIPLSPVVVLLIRQV